MATEQLKIVLTADTKAAQKAIEDFARSTQGVTAQLPKLQRAASQTNGALLSFGRVVQDAPFGLIGIANNIDPLVTSFQGLRQTTGSTGAAFKTLGSALLGPAGIAIAVSAVTSALIAFGPQIGNFISGLLGAKKASEESQKAIQAVADSTAKELVDFQTLVSFAADATKTYDDRKKAIQALRQEYPDYLKGVSDEALLLGKATEASEKFVKSLLQQAVIKTLKDDIAALIAVRAKEIIEIQRRVIETRKEAEAQVEYAKASKAFNEQAVKSLQGGRAAAEGFNKLGQAADNAFANRPDEKIRRITEDLQNQVQTIVDAAGSFTDLGVSLDKTNKSAGGVNRSISEINKAVRDYIQLVPQTNGLQIFKEAQRQTIEKAKDNVKELVTAIQTGVGQAPANLANVFGQISKSITAAKQKNDEEQNKILQKYLKNIENVKNAFTLIGPLIDQTFSALANGENAFDALIQGVKRLIVELLKAAALALILAAVTGGTGSGAAGGGFLSIFKSLLGFKGKAGGGPVGSGSPYLVGENGPELFVPGSSGRIVNNGNLMMGGGSLVARVSGNDLLFLMSKAQNNRNAWR